MFKMMMEVW